MINSEIYDALPVFKTTKEGVEILKEARDLSHVFFLCLRLDRIRGHRLRDIIQLSSQVRKVLEPNETLGGYLHGVQGIDLKLVNSVDNPNLRNIWIDKLIKYNEELNHV
ncbi:hypothetical protein PP742_gp72 [Alcaligenes phage vB_Af_QDWS595]|uniref:Uncharacterized protein n=1 Tax=Alcaligenes phage vB_Af_QDWS595 TaxID=2877946 RepID=A0AAE9C0K0_9CAUD|nr:hypothetical protein PP742_gp72 [Alcaligenes phage vB_Af_QDWS595]UCR75556.1 hypothetical protein vBAfaPQDWS595_72 [Alcaligenes phage vB_Af_QDWS595]